MRLSIVLLFTIGTHAPAGWAFSPYRQTLTGKQDQFVSDGVFIGGKAGSGASLLNVRRAFSAKSQMERVILDLGDKDGKAANGRLGYFQVGVDSKENRIVVDLSQMRLSLISEQKVKDLFRNSHFVRSIELTLDPEDKAATLVLNLKQPMRLEAFVLPNTQRAAGGAGRLVLDLAPQKEKADKDSHDSPPKPHNNSPYPHRG